jgi:hypothetical protein
LRLESTWIRVSAESMWSWIRSCSLLPGRGLTLALFASNEIHGALRVLAWRWEELASFRCSGFESSCAYLSSPQYFTCPLGLQGVQWAVGLIVVRASWLGHSSKLKKKIHFTSQLDRSGNVVLLRCYVLFLHYVINIF